ncbi:MAG: hypothetical protein ACUVQT_04225 [bacterium]
MTNLSSPELVLALYRGQMLIEEGFQDIKDGSLFKRLNLSRADKIGVLVYLFILMIGAQAIKYRWLLEEVSILRKSNGTKRLLSIFRIGLLVAGRANQSNFAVFYFLKENKK